jgi:hypothetical protein
MSRYSHVVEHWTPAAARLKTACGSYVSPLNLKASYTRRKPLYQLPLCPKCAVLMVAGIAAPAEDAALAEA